MDGKKPGLMATEDMPPVACGQSPAAIWDKTESRPHLIIGGITSFSTVDWPERLSCVCFLAGCPWRCLYCHNHELWEAQRGNDHSLQTEFFDLLAKRKGLLDAVVFSGGEPLCQPALLWAVRKVKDMGYEAGLHTAGIFPERLKSVLPYLDWVGMDIKAPWDKYDEITQVPNSAYCAKRSLEILSRANISYEIRTTWHPDLLSPDDMCTIAEQIHEQGVNTWSVQAFRNQGTPGLLEDKSVVAKDVPASAVKLFDNYEFRGF